MGAGISPFGVANYSMMTQLVADSAATREQMDQLTQQAATGEVSQTYAGLGAGAPISLDLNPEIAEINVWQGNINAAQGSMQVTQTALSEVSGIASNFSAELNTLNATDSQAVDTVAASAQQALVQVANLLDSTDGQTYVFAGQDSTNAPVPNPDQILSSGFYTGINSAVAGLATNGATAVTASILAVGSSNAPGTSPFSPALSEPPAALAGQQPTIQVGASQFVAVGVLASTNGFVASTGSVTTGSYMRDVMVGLAAIGSLSSADLNASGFQSLVQNIQSMLQGAVTALNQDAGVLGNQQSALNNAASTLSDTADALKTQVGGVQNVDMASTASQLSLVQTELQASYQVIASMGSLSLVNYL